MSLKSLQFFGISLGLIFLIVSGVFIYLNDFSQNLISPVLGISKTRIADNIWFPSDFSKIESSEDEITAKAAFFVETEGGQVLYQKNPKQKLPIASLVKIMTSIITLENRLPDEVIMITDYAASMEPDKMHLIPKESLTVRELLSGIFLVSANDASEALAEGVTGRREEFINLMNSKAVQLGMSDTNFINPSGLEEDERSQLSTAYDVSLMARYAIKKYPLLTELSSTEHIYIERTNTHQDYDLQTGINLLTTYPGVVGFKTGYTPEAGLTLVTLARRDGKEVLGVLLGSTNRRDDAKALLDYSFQKLGVGEGFL